MVLSNSSWSSSLLYPYGYNQGDSNNSFTDCNNGHVRLTAQPGFPFFNKVQTQIYVSSLDHFKSLSIAFILRAHGFKLQVGTVQKVGSNSVI